MIPFTWTQGECGDCGDKMKVLPSEKYGTCKQCRFIEELTKIAEILEQHMGWH